MMKRRLNTEDDGDNDDTAMMEHQQEVEQIKMEVDDEGGDGGTGGPATTTTTAIQGSNDDASASLSLSWDGFMGGRTEDERQQAIQELHAVYRNVISKVAKWNTMNAASKLENFISVVSFATNLNISDHEKKIALTNFEHETTSQGGYIDTKMGDVFSEPTPRQSKMPDLINTSVETETPKELLLKEIQDIEGDESVAPFLVLLQSSGYGKTRTVLEVAKTRPLVYLLCSKIEGGWSPPNVVKKFVNEIRQERDEENRNDIARMFLLAVIEAAEEYDDPTDLYNAQFAEDGTISTFFYENLDKSWSELRSASPKRTDVSKKNPKKLLVAFDESSALAAGANDSVRSPYRCIRSQLKELKILGIFLDTFGSMKDFLPENTKNSDRSTGLGRFQPPVFEIDTFDTFTDHFLFLGRPLWKMQWLYRNDKNHTKLVEFAAHKLHRGRTDGLVAMFLCRFGLNPIGDLATRLVASHMATLVAVSVDRKILVTKYKSEPILSEASSYLSEYCSKKLDVLQEVNIGLRSQILTAAKGDRGEIAAAAWFGYTLDGIRKVNGAEYDAERHSLSREVDVLQFVKALCPTGVSISDEIASHLQELEVNVTHFCRLGYSPSRDILPICWKRRVGIYLPEGEEGIDILIAIRERNLDQFTTMRVQVKNYKNRIRESSAKEYFQKLDIRRCAPLSTLAEEPLSIALLVQVGKGSIEPQVSLQTLGRTTRHSTSEAGKQIQIVCSLDLVEDSAVAKELQAIAGDEIDNIEFKFSSESFRDGELQPKDGAA